MKKLVLFFSIFFLSAASTQAMPIMPVEDGGGSSSPPPEKVLVLEYGNLLGLGVGNERTSLVAGVMSASALNSFNLNDLADPPFVEILCFWEPAEEGILLGSFVVCLNTWGRSVWAEYGHWDQSAGWPSVYGTGAPPMPWNLPVPFAWSGGEPNGSQKKGKPSRRLVQGKFRTGRGAFSCVFTPAGDNSQVDCQSDPGVPFPVRTSFTWAEAWSVKTEWYLADCACWGDPPGRPVGEGEE